MKSFFIFLLLISGAMAAFSQSQSELNKQAGQEYKNADKKLNDIYQLILKDYAANKAFIKNLKDAQRIWIQFRDAQVQAMYPAAAKSYGSVFPMCRANYMTELTNQRTEALRVWLNGLPQGDVCTGSIGDKQGNQ
ncbi:lysozyme inhibitor LprI family protein [Chitinophaga polysaccharea]|uniref:lysozyme inhibitor LprI family protein n=1 Tax=Chitinophaga polysaccharea TaxID=1293035 RepID=UPI00115A6411|nr:lysozyme inhibitor LprI family protein [Chitinophaga polysaccharea]